MSRRIVYVNGAYRVASDALISFEDRGFQFGDAIYEVWGVRGGRLLDAEAHFARLTRSLREIELNAPMDEGALKAVISETMRRNRVRDGLVYLQISRGAAVRDHVFPPADTPATIVVSAKNLDLKALERRGREGVSVISAPDERWGRCDIKSTNLLANVLGREQARRAGAFEVWFLDADGKVTEGSASTAWIVDAEGRLRTRALSHAILPGVTRARLIEIAESRQISIAEEAFTLSEARAAREAFLTSATNGPVPITRIDGEMVAGGSPGPMTQMLRDAYFGTA